MYMRTFTDGLFHWYPTGLKPMKCCAIKLTSLKTELISPDKSVEAITETNDFIYLAIIYISHWKNKKSNYNKNKKDSVHGQRYLLNYSENLYN